MILEFSPEDFRQMLQFFEEHHISPVIDKTYPLEEALMLMPSCEVQSRIAAILINGIVDIYHKL